MPLLLSAKLPILCSYNNSRRCCHGFWRGGRPWSLDRELRQQVSCGRHKNS